jgi:hypothetical protein
MKHLSLSVLTALLLVAGILGRPAIAQTNFNVTVANKTAAHPWSGQGWPEGYVINGSEGATLTLERGVTYTFQMQNVPGLHPFYISTSSSGAGAGVYSDGVDGNFASGNQTLTFTPSADAPNVLYYQCSSHDFMGGTINITGSVSADDPAELPSAIALEQNYPNPFNPSTVIRFTLPVAAQVTLTVFDATGREVSTVAAGTFSAGVHEVTWDGADDAGRMLPSGQYFYRLESGTERRYRALTIMR